MVVRINTAICLAGGNFDWSRGYGHVACLVTKRVDHSSASFSFNGPLAACIAPPLSQVKDRPPPMQRPNWLFCLLREVETPKNPDTPK